MNATKDTSELLRLAVLHEASRNRTAKAFRRWFAILIDLVLIGAYFLAAQRLLGQALYEKFLPPIIVVAAFYIPICESQWNGSVGKHLLGLMVVDSEGEKPSLFRSCVRFLILFVEGNMVFGFFSVWLMSKAVHGLRLGDLVAKTFVISRHRLD